MSQSSNARRSEVRIMVMVLGFAGILAATSLILNALTWTRLQQNIGRQHRATHQLAELRFLLSTLLDVELGARGFIITGDESYEAVMQLARNGFAERSIELSQLAANETVAVQGWAEIRPLADNLLTAAQEATFLRKHQGAEAAEAYFMRGQAQEAISVLRVRFQELLTRQEASIAKRETEMSFDLQAGAVTSTATGLLALGIGGIAFLLLRRVLREMDRVERYSINVVKAERAKQQKDAFVAMMSHEIRTPLNAIIGFSQLLEQEAKSSVTRRYAQSILAGGQALLQLINDVLDLSKLEAGMMKLSPEPTDLRDMIALCERIFSEQCASKGIEFRVAIADGTPESLVLDAVRLRQVLINLLGNAVKFTERGSVTLDVRSRKNAADSSKYDLEFSVTDTGAGIDEADRDRIFEPFVQSGDPHSHSTDQGMRGTGLGLSIVRRFLSVMNGRIKVESDLGKGTTFRIFIPSLNVSARVLNTESLDEANVDFNRFAPAVILSADDNPTNRELMAEIFRNTHHSVHCAANGLEACEQIEALRPDLVFLDIRMPVMDGVEAARRLKENPEFQTLPVIAVTAGSVGDDQVGGPSAEHFDSWIRKPYTRKALFDEMANFLKVQSRAESVDDAEADPPAPLTPEAGAELMRLRDEEWPGVESRHVISEVAAFGQKLRTLAEEQKIPTLANYAENLCESTEAFAVQEMAALLAKFPAMLKALGIDKESL